MLLGKQVLVFQVTAASIFRVPSCFYHGYGGMFHRNIGNAAHFHMVPTLKKSLSINIEPLWEP
jgi:hypothetical protein